MSLCCVLLCSGRGGLFKRLAGDGSLTLLGEFSGQGRPWLSALRELDQWATAEPSRAAFRQLMQRAMDTLRELAEDEEVQSVGVHRQGFDVRAWISQPDTAPEEAYLTRSVSRIASPTRQSAKNATD